MSLPLFDLVEWFSTAEGRFDLSLGHSGCQALRVGDILDEEELRAFVDVDLNYGDFEGFAELREMIAGGYETIQPAEVLTFNGPSEAIYTFMQSVLGSGDEVVVPAPLFHPLQAIARHVGCQIKEWQAVDDASCQFRVDDLAALCTPATKMILINFPHNPSGQMITETEQRQIIEIAKASDAILFSDEVFRLLELPPLSPLPAACDLYKKAVSVAGLSKPYGLGGLRIGWLATKSEEIRTAARQYRFNTCEMTNTPTQWLGCRALERGEQIVSRNRELIAANLGLLSNLAEKHVEILQLHRPKAGTMALVEQKTKLTSTEFCQRILEEERLFLIPGKPLGMSDQLLRMGLGASDFHQGLERLDRFLQRQKSTA